MFRFTIRDVLWLTVVVALGVAWAVERSVDTKPRYGTVIFNVNGNTYSIPRGSTMAMTYNLDGTISERVIPPGGD